MPSSLATKRGIRRFHDADFMRIYLGFSPECTVSFTNSAPWIAGWRQADTP